MERGARTTPHEVSQSLIRVNIQPSAEAEADEAAAWYEAQQPGLGMEFLLELDAAIERAAETPVAYGQIHRYEKWKDIVAISGPEGSRSIKGFNDEPLAGEWKGHRSSRLNQQYRVIYRIERNQVMVEVVSLTAHDYRRK